MMATTVHLSPALLDSRLDAVYYSPAYLANHEALVRSSVGRAHLNTLVKAGRRAVYFSTDTLDAEEAPEHWIPFLTADDLSDDGCFVNLDAQKRVSPEFAEQYPNGRLRSNELLVKVKGPNQTTAYNETEPERAVLVSGTIWGALVDTALVDPYYLVAALSCHYSATARNRLRTNTNVEFLAAEDLLDLLVPIPLSPLAQTFIGNQLRRAKFLRDLGKRLQATGNDYFANYQPDQTTLMAERAYRARTSNLSEARLDPTFYHPGYVALDNKLSSLSCRPIWKVAGLPNDAWGQSDAIIQYFEIGDVDISTGLIKGNPISNADAPASAQKLIQPWDVVVATVRPNRKNVGIVLPDENPLPKVASSAFAVLRFENPQDACFYHAWLRTDAGTNQLVRWNAGSTYPTIEREVPSLILAPAVSESDRQRIGAIWMTGLCSFSHSQSLKAAAKLVVDSLIEGKVTEAELVAAQEALERGDATADRALLRRLTRHSLDAPGQPPLFPDLDGLYALLAQTREGTA